MGRLIDADAIISFPYSPESGTEDMIEEWIVEAGICGASVGFDEGITEKARELCKLVIEGFINIIKTEPTAYEAPPLKIGDTAWAIRKYKGATYAQQGIVNEMFYNKNMELVIVVKNIARGLFGEKVFATKEEAEQALKQMGE